MSLWKRLFKRSAETRADFKRIVSEAQEALARGENPRYSPAVGELLGLFWDDKTPLPSTMQNYLNPYDGSVSYAPNAAEYLQRFRTDLRDVLRQQQPVIPSGPEARYEATVAALRVLMQISLVHIRERRSQPGYLPGATLNWDTFFRLAVAVKIVQYLQAAEVYDLCCDLLPIADEALIKMRGKGIGLFTLLRDALHDYLAALPPEEIPQFWESLKDPRTSREFWPIVRRMRDRRAVPLLLDALPELALDGQSAVVVALQQIGDARAVPALQALAADRSSLLAPIAEQAVAHILKHSRDDAAQLLRPTDARHASRAGETLLRPAASAPDMNVRAEELLRPGSAPEE
jgi:hypothetical protein